jgi:redox-sensitive bicupin YhaK (pirin superfamily)
MITVRRAEDRFETRTGWLTSRHSFSFGQHYHPAETHFGLLLVSNDDVVAPGTGFDTHPHRDTEIVTWVLEGALVHQDSEGHNGVIHPGLAQRMSAGRGILHSERNDSWRLTGGAEHRDPVRFVQMWVRPDEPGIEPGYQQAEIGAQLSGGGLVPVASGRPGPGGEAAIRIRQKDAALHAAILAPGAVAAIPAAPFAHLYVARGGATLEGGGELREGDAARIEDAQGQRVTAGPAGAEILVWEMHSAL